MKKIVSLVFIFVFIFTSNAQVYPKNLYDTLRVPSTSLDVAAELKQALGEPARILLVDLLIKEASSVDNAALSPFIQSVLKILEGHKAQKDTRVLAGLLVKALEDYERGSDYSLWNIKKQDIDLWGIKQCILALDIFYRRAIPFIEEKMGISDGQKKELVRILEYLFMATFSDMLKGKKSNPVHHNIQVLENMLEIVNKLNQEKPGTYDYKWIRDAAVLALLHDIGNANLPPGTEKVKESDIKKAISESKLKADIEKVVADAIAYRRAHMVSGADIVRGILEKFNRDFRTAPFGHNKDVFSKAAITKICRVVGIHDNPSIASYCQKYGMYIKTGKADRDYLIKNGDTLAVAMRDADRLWMVSREGLEKDLVDDVKKGDIPHPKRKLNHNISRFQDEKGSYDIAGISGDFYKGTLFRTEGGKELFERFKTYWAGRFSSGIRASSAGSWESILKNHIAAFRNPDNAKVAFDAFYNSVNSASKAEVRNVLLPFLLERLSSSDDIVERQEVMFALEELIKSKKINGKRAVSALTEVVKSPSDGNISGACFLLINILGDDAVPVLEEISSDTAVPLKNRHYATMHLRKLTEGHWSTAAAFAKDALYDATSPMHDDFKRITSRYSIGSQPVVVISQKDGKLFKPVWEPEKVKSNILAHNLARLLGIDNLCEFRSVDMVYEVEAVSRVFLNYFEQVGKDMRVGLERFSTSYTNREARAMKSRLEELIVLYVFTRDFDHSFTGPAMNNTRAVDRRNKKRMLSYDHEYITLPNFRKHAPVKKYADKIFFKASLKGLDMTRVLATLEKVERISDAKLERAVDGAGFKGDEANRVCQYLMRFRDNLRKDLAYIFEQYNAATQDVFRKRSSSAGTDSGNSLDVDSVREQLESKILTALQSNGVVGQVEQARLSDFISLLAERRILEYTAEQKEIKPGEINLDMFSRGIRGNAERDLPDSVVLKIGMALGTFLKRHKEEGPIVFPIGGDVRESTPRIKRALVEGMRKTGIDIIDIGLATTPLCVFAMRYLGTIQGAVSISGSHNPAPDNGIKPIIGIKNIGPAQIAEIRDIIVADDYDISETEGSYTTRAVDEEYVNYIRNYVAATQKEWALLTNGDADIELILTKLSKRHEGERPLERMTIVFDSGNGAAVDLPKRIFELLGAKVIMRYAEPDGSFPHHVPNPQEHKNLQDLIDAVKKHKADIGFAFDTDGDRIGIVTPSGQIVEGENIAAVLAKFALDTVQKTQSSAEKPTIVIDLNTSEAIIDYIVDNGGEPVFSLTGVIHMQNTIERVNAICGAESSAHIYSKDNAFVDDGIFIAAAMLKLMTETKKGIEELVADVRYYPTQPTMRLVVKGPDVTRTKIKIVEEVGTYLKEQGCDCIDMGDKRYLFKDDSFNSERDKLRAWAVIRCSATEPKITVRIGAKTQEEFEKYKKFIITKLAEFPEVDFGENSAELSELTGLDIWSFDEDMAIEAFVEKMNRAASAGNGLSDIASVNLTININGSTVETNIVNSDGELLLDIPLRIKWKEAMGISPVTPDFWFKPNADQIMEIAVELLAQVLEKASINIKSIGKIGISVAGPVDAAKGIVGVPFKAPNTPFDNYNMVQELQDRARKRFDIENIEVELLNDCDAALKGELSPNGTLSLLGADRGSVVIIGTGFNIASGDPRVKEAGHQLIPTDDLPPHYTPSKGAYTYVGLETKGDHPQNESGTYFYRDIEDRCSGPNIARRFAENPREVADQYILGIKHRIGAYLDSDPEARILLQDKNLDDVLKLLEDKRLFTTDEEKIRLKVTDAILRSITDAAQGDNSKPDRLAREWIVEIGEEVGNALAAFIATYKNEEFVRHIVLVSDVNENFGKGVTDSLGNDLYMQAIRSAVVCELVSYYDIEPERARVFADGIVRSELTHGRESLAFVPVKQAGRSSSAGDEDSYTLDEESDILFEEPIDANVVIDASYKVFPTIGVFDIYNPKLSEKIDGKRCLIVIDDGVEPYIIDDLKAYAAHYGIKIETLSVPGGEESKLGGKYVDMVYDKAIEMGLDRKEMIIGIGGGAVIDMVGWAANGLDRGVDYGRIPTTLLSQMDASVGTKNAVNYYYEAGDEWLKNKRGSFYPAKWVLVDPNLLKTLDSRQMRSGMAEAIKVALMKDKEFFKSLEDNFQAVLNKDFSPESPALHIIKKTIELHIAQINTDPYERELARPLDFGHPGGHYLESKTHYRISHGEGVAIGMAIDSVISYNRSKNGVPGFNLSEQSLNRILNLIEAIGLPIYDKAATVENILAGIEEFRLHLGGPLTIPLLADIGEVVNVGDPVEGEKRGSAITKQEIEEAIAFLKDRVTRASSAGNVPIKLPSARPAGDKAIGSKCLIIESISIAA